MLGTSATGGWTRCLPQPPLGATLGHGLGSEGDFYFPSSSSRRGPSVFQSNANSLLNSTGGFSKSKTASGFFNKNDQSSSIDHAGSSTRVGTSLDSTHHTGFFRPRWREDERLEVLSKVRNMDARLQKFGGSLRKQDKGILLLRQMHEKQRMGATH